MNVLTPMVDVNTTVLKQMVVTTVHVLMGILLMRINTAVTDLVSLYCTILLYITLLKLSNDSETPNRNFCTGNAIM